MSEVNLKEVLAEMLRSMVGECEERATHLRTALTALESDDKEALLYHIRKANKAGENQWEEIAPGTTEAASS